MVDYRQGVIEIRNTIVQETQDLDRFEPLSYVLLSGLYYLRVVDCLEGVSICSHIAWGDRIT